MVWNHHSVDCSRFSTTPRLQQMLGLSSSSSMLGPGVPTPEPWPVISPLEVCKTDAGPHLQKLCFQVYGHGSLTAAVHSLSHGFILTAQTAGRGSGARPQTPAARQSQGHQQRPKATLDDVSDAVRHLPLEVHASQQEVEKMSVRQLKVCEDSDSLRLFFEFGF